MYNSYAIISIWRITKKHLYIIAGANGSGKSTLAHQLLPVKKLEFLNADEIALEINPKAIDKVKISAGKEYFKRLQLFFNNEKSFIIETTLSGQTLEKTIKKAKKLNYEITLVYVFIDNPQICIERIKVRVLKGGHNIPEEDVIRRYKRSKENFCNIYKDMVDEWAVYYNGKENFVEVFKNEGKGIEIIHETLYNKFIKGIEL